MIRLSAVWCTRLLSGVQGYRCKNLWIFDCVMESDWRLMGLCCGRKYNDRRCVLTSIAYFVKEDAERLLGLQILVRIYQLQLYPGFCSHCYELWLDVLLCLTRKIHVVSVQRIRYSQEIHRCYHRKNSSVPPSKKLIRAFSEEI